MLTTNGYFEIKDLNIGDYLITIGENTKKEKNQRQCWRSKGKIYSNAGFMAGADNISFVDGRTRLYKSAKENVYRRANGKCEICDKLEDGSKFEFAHLSTLESNNGDYEKYHSVKNIKYLCNPCHKKLDYSNGIRKKRWSKGKPIINDKIISIEPHGIIDIYDIEMATENHNFVANGIVSHNESFGLLFLYCLRMCVVKNKLPQRIYVCSFNL